jgi:hypothetical protein
MMDEIRRKIGELNTDEEILQFVIQRLNELESESVEKTVGQNHGDSFRDYISEKVHFKPTHNIDGKECPDLVYDNRTPYFDLLKEIKANGGYNPQSILTTIFLNEYLPNNKDLGERFQLYKSNTSGRVSITEVREKRAGYCSEVSGLSHNLFKFLGIDSEFVPGTKNGEPHAYNFIYPKGYDNEPMVLYDPNDFVDFIKGDSKRSFAFYKAFKREDYDKFLLGEPLQIDLSKTEEDYRRIYGPSGYLDGYLFVRESHTYTYGSQDQKTY